MSGVEPSCETSVPGIDGDLVPDRTDLDSAFEQASPRHIEVGDDEVNVAKRSGERISKALLGNH